MNRQYIGARYVPKFADPIAWDKANSYEALTIVTYLNNSYTSKKPVPANTEITDTEYWVVTGNYNAQVEEYRQETVNLKNTVEETYSKLSEDIMNVDGKATTKAGYGYGLFIGDSYSSNKPTNGAVLYTEDLPTIISNRLGLLGHYNYAIPGAGYVNGDTRNQHFMGQLVKANGELTAEQKNGVSYVFVLGGQNDASHSISDVSDNVSTLITAIKNTYVNAKVVVLPLWYNRAVSDACVARFTIIYYHALLNGCLTDKRSWNYLISTQTTFMSDGVHPTQDTLKMLGGMIACKVQGGDPQLIDYTGVFTKQAIISAVGSYAWFDGETVHLHLVGSCSASVIPVGTNIGAFAQCYAPKTVKIFKCLTGTDTVQFQVDTMGIITTMTELSQNEVFLLDIVYPLFEGVIASL